MTCSGVDSEAGREVTPSVGSGRYDGGRRPVSGPNNDERPPVSGPSNDERPPEPGGRPDAAHSGAPLTVFVQFGQDSSTLPAPWKKSQTPSLSSLLPLPFVIQRKAAHW